VTPAVPASLILVVEQAAYSADRAANDGACHQRAAGHGANRSAGSGADGRAADRSFGGRITAGDRKGGCQGCWKDEIDLHGRVSLRMQEFKAGVGRFWSAMLPFGLDLSFRLGRL
jgi:hypothetical protein